MNGIEVLLQLKDKITGAMQGAENKLAQMAQKMQVHADKISFSQVKAMKAAQSEIPGFSRLTDLATNKYVLMGAGAVAVGGAIVKAVSMANEWDTKMAELNVTIDKTPQELKKVSEHLLSLGGKYPVALENIPIALNKIVSAGIEYNDAMKMLEPTLMASKAGFVDVGIAADAAVGFMAGSGIKDATEAWDVLFAVQAAGKGSMEDIARYMPSLIPTLRGAGFGAKESAGAFAYLSTKLNSIPEVTTKLQALGRVFSNSDVTDKFKKMGINVFNKDGSIKTLEDIAKMVSSKTKGLSDQKRSSFMSNLGLDGESSSALKLLIGDIAKLSEITNSVKNSQGALKQSYENSRTPLDNIIIITNQIKAGFIRLGQSISAIIAPVLKFVVHNMDTIKTILKAIGYVALGAVAGFLAFKTVMLSIIAIKKV